MSIRFQDIRLELAVREALDAAGLEPAEAAALRVLPAYGHGVRHLGGIDQLAGLRWLDLRRNPLVSLAPLAGLVELTRLSLREAPLSSLRPLAGLATLESLDVRDIVLPRIDDLAHVGALRRLSLIDCLVSDLRPLTALTRLESLALGNLVYADHPRFGHAPLGELISLRELTLHRARLPSAAVLAKLVALESLSLRGCTLGDQLAAFPELPRLRHLSLAGCEISNLSSLAHLSTLESLDLSDTKVDDLSALDQLHTLRILNLDDTDLRQRDLDRLELPHLSEVRLPSHSPGRYVF